MYNVGAWGPGSMGLIALRGVIDHPHLQLVDLVVHSDADRVVPMVEGETMYAALMKGGVPTSFIRIEGAGHDFAGVDRSRATAAMLQWF